MLTFLDINVILYFKLLITDWGEYQLPARAGLGVGSVAPRWVQPFYPTPGPPQEFPKLKFPKVVVSLNNDFTMLRYVQVQFF